MSKTPKHERIAAYTIITFLRPFINMRWATAAYIYFLQRWGTRFTGCPAYISGRVDIDGTDFSLITLGESVTLPGNARILTHDWSPYTVGKAVGVYIINLLGRIQLATINDYSFIKIGSMVIGNPGQIAENSWGYMTKKFPEHVAVISQDRGIKTNTWFV